MSLSQLCAGLKHMHSLEPPYAHNDVKPGNILITHRKGQAPLAILMDFGSARPARKQICSRAEALQLQVLIVPFIVLNNSLLRLNLYAILIILLYHFLFLFHLNCHICTFSVSYQLIASLTMLMVALWVLIL